MPLPPLPAADLDAILTLTAPLWEPMRGERLLLTGGTGFFGCWLVESFLHINRALALNAGITVLTRDPAAFLKKLPHLRGEAALHLLTGDVRTFTCPDPHAYVIHAATAAGARQPGDDPAEMFSTILDGTAQILRFASAAGTRTLLLTSSGAVYGPQPAELSHLPETYMGAPDPLARASVYAEGKRAAELLCALAASDALEIKIARCFAFTGAHLPLDGHFAAGNFLADALAGSPSASHPTAAACAPTCTPQTLRSGSGPCSSARPHCVRTTSARLSRSRSAAWPGRRRHRHPACVRRDRQRSRRTQRLRSQHRTGGGGARPAPDRVTCRGSAPHRRLASAAFKLKSGEASC